MKALKYLTILLAVALVQGCAKQRAAIVEQEVPAFDPDLGEEPTIPSSNAVLILNDHGQPISEGMLNGYLGDTPAKGYGAGSARLSLGLTQIGDGYGGYVKISFLEHGQESVVYQQTKHPDYKAYSAKDVRHNIWFQRGGKATGMDSSRTAWAVWLWSSMMRFRVAQVTTPTTKGWQDPFGTKTLKLITRTTRSRATGRAGISPSATSTAEPFSA